MAHVVLRAHRLLRVLLDVFAVKINNEKELIFNSVRSAESNSTC